MAIAEKFEGNRTRRSPFTTRTVLSMKEPGRYSDAGCKGLWLQISLSGTKSWLLRYMLDGRARAMGLGPLELVPLADARERARAARRLLLDGKDPIEERKAQELAGRLEAARSLTFQDCAERYIAAHETSWRNPKHRAQWKSTLATYAYPDLGGLPVATVDTQLVLHVLEPLWTKRPETAGRLRGRIESVLDWAAARAYRQGDIPARWRGHLDKLLPSKSKIAPVQHHPAIPYRDLPTFMAELCQNGSISALALEMAILTASRTGEIIGAAWLEIDLDARIWTVPANRMKGGRPHRVPLSDRCMARLGNSMITS
jgi:Arm DNA-binding domain/Phage integrase family